MNRRGAVATTAVAAIALAGCGGSSNKQLSYSGFISKADAICRKGQAATNTAQSTSQAAKILEKYVKQFKGLKPPEKLKPAYDQFVAISDQQVAALKRGDANTANALGAKSNESASKMGTADCISH